MIVVFVVDTSKSMAKPSQSGGGLTGHSSISRLDLAKMSVENLSRSLDRRIVEHNRSVLMMASAQQQQSQQHINSGRIEQFDEFTLLSTSLQLSANDNGSPSLPSLDSIEACGAGGRMLVGSVFDPSSPRLYSNTQEQGHSMIPHPPDRHEFEYELKRLKAAEYPENQPFPDWAGGAIGLNAALSHGLGLLSRHRLTRGRDVEHFGLGRLPWFHHQMANISNNNKQRSTGGDHDFSSVASPLQPACLILLTDGECLRLPPEKGGGRLSLRFGNIPLREFYREPFRWDQRIFILHTADVSTPPLHKSLRALCEVTGGAYIRINPTDSLSNILMRISPPRPNSYSIPDPLRMSPPTPINVDWERNVTTSFINGGPVCSFQCMESAPNQQASIHRAMIMFAGSCEQPRWILNHTLSNAPTSKCIPNPIWSIPESHFPSKKLDTLPPRPSQPLLHYSRNYQSVMSSTFDPYYVMKALHHLDHLYVSIQQLLLDAGDNPPPLSNRMLQRDVYICDWLGEQESTKSSPNNVLNVTGAPRTEAGREHFPVCVKGAGRPTLSGDGGDNVLNIGILHVPCNWIKLRDTDAGYLANESSPIQVSTLTLLPPHSNILLPLLIKVAELELRMLKKVTENNKDVTGARSGATAGLIKKKINSATAARAIHLDDTWKSDFRAYLYRLPPYYLPAVRRVLRSMLPQNVLALLNVESHEVLPLLCMSPTCLNKIHNGEKAAKNSIDWQRSMEKNMKNMRTRQARSTVEDNSQLLNKKESQTFGYGEYDPRMTEQQFKHLLRNLAPPWKNGIIEEENSGGNVSPVARVPTSCMLAYYESRRRWIFGGSGLSTRGLHVEGLNDGVNTHHYNSSGNIEDQPLIALAGFCGTINETSIAKMGDFREQLNFSPTSFVDYGQCNSSGAAVTTAADGSPTYSVDDDALPLNFFDAESGEFIDSPEARFRARLYINFGNPFQDKRGGSISPLKYRKSSPAAGVGPRTPQSSPPHDAYESHSPIEGEGEAAFTGKRPPGSPPQQRRDSTKRDAEHPMASAEAKRIKMLDERTESRKPPPRPPPPPPPPHSQQKRASKRGHKIVPPPKPPPGQKITPQKPPPPKRMRSKEEIVSSTTHVGQLSTTAQANSSDLTNPNEKPKVQLPENWICVWSKSQQRWYFFDKRTKKSVWAIDHIKAAQNH